MALLEVVVVFDEKAVEDGVFAQDFLDEDEATVLIESFQDAFDQ